MLFYLLIGLWSQPLTWTGLPASARQAHKTEIMTTFEIKRKIICFQTTTTCPPMASPRLNLDTVAENEIDTLINTNKEKKMDIRG